MRKQISLQNDFDLNQIPKIRRGRWPNKGFEAFIATYLNTEDEREYARFAFYKKYGAATRLNKMKSGDWQASLKAAKEWGAKRMGKS